MDYRRYRWKRRELVLYILEAAALTGITAFCFYDSPWACAAFPVFLPLFLREKKQQLNGKRAKALKLQFKAAVQGIAAALAAGYSVENALREAEKDLRLMYSGEADMIQELASMQRKLSANQSIEEVMLDFAGRSGLEEAETFAEIFASAKRGGGDLIGIMKDTAGIISETIETEHQVASALAARRYEQKLMNRIPFAMVIYLRAGCNGFLDPLYGNVVGICVMTAALSLYLTAWYLGKKLLQIEV